MTPFSTNLFEHEWIPATRNVSKAEQKVMVVLHGKGDSLRAFRTIKSELRLPHLNYLLINAPRKFLSGYSWYGSEPRHQKGVLRSRNRLFLLIEELNRAGWKSKDILFMGHSQGCLMACDLVLNHPDSFAGLVGVSGYLWFFPGWRRKIARSGARKTPWLLTHGTHDRVISPRDTRRDVEELTRGRVPVLYREFKKGHDFDYRQEVPFIRSWLRNGMVL